MQNPIIGAIFLVTTCGLVAYLIDNVRRLKSEVATLKLRLEAREWQQYIAEGQPAEEEPEPAAEEAPAMEFNSHEPLINNLTGLPNGRSLYQFFQAEANRSTRHGYGIALLTIEINVLDLISDLYSPFTSYQFLQESAETLRSCLRAYDFLAHCDTDQFIAILPETTADDLHGLIMRIQDSIEGIIYRRFTKLSDEVGLSIGSAEYGRDGYSLEDLLTAAQQSVEHNAPAASGQIAEIKNYQEPFLQ